MIEYPVNKNKPHDEGLVRIANICKSRTQDPGREDDVLFFAAGLPGTGKSMLKLHLMTAIDKDWDMSSVAFTPQDLANSLRELKDKDGVRLLLNDEGNLSRRAAMATYNKDILDLYYKIRYLRIIHLWCNPSIDIIDRPFIEERVLGAFFLFDKRNKPRFYYYVRRKELLQILEKYKNLKLRTVHKVIGKYAAYKGWFYNYTGHNKDKYVIKKEGRTHDIVNAFADTYGSNNLDKYIKSTVAAKQLLLTSETLLNNVKKLIKSNQLLEGEHYAISANQKIVYTQEGLNTIRTKLKEKSQVKFDYKNEIKT